MLKIYPVTLAVIRRLRPLLTVIDRADFDRVIGTLVRRVERSA